MNIFSNWSNWQVLSLIEAAMWLTWMFSGGSDAETLRRFPLAVLLTVSFMVVIWLLCKAFKI